MKKLIFLSIITVIIFLFLGCPVIGDQDLILIAELKEEIRSNTQSILPESERQELEVVMETATTDELVRLNDAVESFSLLVADYYGDSRSTSNANSKWPDLLEFAEAVNKTKDNIVNAFDGDKFNDVINQYLDFGFGYNRELLTSGGVSGGVSYAVVGGFVELEIGTGAGYAFDFRNFASYEYDAYFSGQSAGLTFGVDGTPISASADIAVILSENLVFGLEHGQEYESAPSVGVGLALGVEGSIFAGFGFSVTGSYIEELDSDWVPSDLPSLPTGSATNVKSISVASKAKTGAGVEIELMGSIGASGVISYNDIVPGSMKKYIAEETATRAEFTAAGFEMARDLLICGDIGPSKTITWFSAANAILYGLFYVPEDYNSPEELPGTNITPPSEVTNLSITPGNKMVKLDWDDPSNSDFDSVQLSWTPNNPTPLIVDVGEESFTIMALENGVEYNFTLKTIDVNGNLSTGRTVAGTPDRSAVISGVVDVFINNTSQHSLFLKNDGTLWGTGRNDAGQLGLGDKSNRRTPVQIMTNVKTAASGQKHTMIVKTDGTLWACGDNTYGQFGNGTNTASLTPIQVMTDISDVAAGWGHTLIVKNDGTLLSAGYNYSGQLGDGTISNRSTPQTISSNVVMIDVGSGHSLFMKDDGSLWAMGANGLGQFGGGSISNSYSPIKIMDDVSFIDAGGLHSLIIKNDGSLWLTGWNTTGQIGNGDTENQLVPILIDNDVISASGGWFYSIYLKSDGSVWSMGENGDGQLGDGTLVDQLTPINSLNNALDVYAGSDHCFALLNDGSLSGTGQNFLGNLGNGYTTQVNTFASITF